MNPGMYSIAVPILKQDGRVAGSLLLLGAVDEADESMKLVQMLQEKAAKISTSLSDFEEPSREDA